MLGMLMANCYKIYGLSIGLDDKFLTIAGSTASVANGCSRALWAMLLDKTSFRFVLMINMVIQMIMAVCLGISYLFILSLR
jgi:sugar phosphate permease